MSNERFIPDPAQAALFPDISGNTINGLGEVMARRPRYVYWGNDPDEIAHGALQRWFYTVDPGLAAYADVRRARAEVLDAALGPLATDTDQIAPDDWHQFVARSVSVGDFDKAGVTAFDPQWAFEGVEIRQKNIIISGRCFCRSFDRCFGRFTVRLHHEFHLSYARTSQPRN